MLAAFGQQLQSRQIETGAQLENSLALRGFIARRPVHRRVGYRAEAAVIWLPQGRESFPK